jgi:hypothetical protein
MAWMPAYIAVRNLRSMISMVNGHLHLCECSLNALFARCCYMACNWQCFNAVFFKLFMVQCSIFQQFPSFNSRYFQHAYISTTIFHFLILCRLYAQPVQPLCSSCGPPPYYCLTQAYHKITQLNNISLVHIHTQRTVQCAKTVET